MYGDKTKSDRSLHSCRVNGNRGAELTTAEGPESGQRRWPRLRAASRDVAGPVATAAVAAEEEGSGMGERSLGFNPG